MKFGPKYFQAANLIDQAYKGTLVYSHSLDVDGVQAYLTPDGVLVVPGTNERRDWFLYNFKVGRGETSEWHEGFLNHAKVVYPFAKLHNPNMITGHSLGAASVQILFNLHIDTLAFASPRTFKGTQEQAEALTTHVINICREDDIVTGVPKRLKHVGEVIWCEPNKHHWGEDHRIDKYIDIMNEANE